MYTHSKQIITAGTPAAQATGALVMLHGRGGSAQDIVSLSRSLNTAGLAIYAPQATNNSWYPYSFVAPDAQNQPALNSALQVVGELVGDIIAQGIPANKIYFAGFSQGACLTLEYITRNAQRYAGAVGFTGGLIGEHFEPTKYTGDFVGTPVLITTGNPDSHIPLQRVEESIAQLESMGAMVTSKVYAGRAHTISLDEVRLANEVVFGG